MGKMVCWELGYVMHCILWGFVLAVLYDFLRIQRIVWRKGNFRIAVEDILYWSFAAVGTYHLFYTQDNGVIRWFAIGITFLIMLLMNRFISKRAVPFLSKILSVPVRIFERILQKINQSFHKIGKIILKSLKSLGKRIKIKKKTGRKRKQKQNGKNKAKKVQE